MSQTTIWDTLLSWNQVNMTWSEWLQKQNKHKERDGDRQGGFFQLLLSHSYTEGIRLDSIRRNSHSLWTNRFQLLVLFCWLHAVSTKKMKKNWHRPKVILVFYMLKLLLFINWLWRCGCNNCIYVQYMLTLGRIDLISIYSASISLFSVPLHFGAVWL